MGIRSPQSQYDPNGCALAVLIGVCGFFGLLIGAYWLALLADYVWNNWVH